ncbi:DNA polymerase III subunit gamma/tau [Limisalsivibrio acetivorans]|uniref:DNA polymerase III subunit gamma/tau n=1 Tax=Limisalsivibrio acetivorans TaxID=1304888 RepID=UPI0003B619EC|nr:DNA polymerase III subunit gamma/tau [Limisalsivibrio acetivorans]
MSYLALARKLRPQNFDEIVAQEFVVTTLKNAMEMDRLVHAYLFTGPRGVGKTSTARIFAKALNCLSPKGVNPCNECENCLEITGGTSMDVIEVDGASNRGIDEIRDLREAVKFFPVKCRKKVYIIDEVHMLTEQAFNALLKTLEEPPEHALFILATTDPQRIPATIISRTQKYDFRKIPFERMYSSLSEILAKEGIEYDEDALNLVIRNSDGCMRDSLSMLDQIIAYTNGRVDESNTAFLLGYSEASIIVELFKAILEERKEDIAGHITELTSKGVNLKFAAESLIEHTRNLLFYMTGGGTLKGLTSYEEELYSDLSLRVTEHRLFALFQIFQKLLNDLKFFSFDQYVFEFAMYKAASFSAVIPVTGGTPQAAVSSARQSPARSAQQSPSHKAPRQESPSQGGGDKWQEMIKHISEENAPVASYLSNVYLSRVEGDTLYIGVAEEKRFYVQMLEKPETRDYLNKTAGKFYPGVSYIKAVLDSEPKKKTVTEKKKERETYYERKTKKEAGENEVVKQLKQEFEGEILDIKVLGTPDGDSEQTE